METTVPARYLPFLADVLRRAVRDIRLDESLRSDPDARLHQMSPVPDSLIDATAADEACVQVVAPSLSEVPA
jgi:hypothetical protein